MTIRTPGTFAHGIHLVQRVSQRSGVLKARGKYHLSQHGPVTLCGESLDLPRTQRRDLYVSELLTPESGVDVCEQCMAELMDRRPDLWERAEQVAADALTSELADDEQPVVGDPQPKPDGTSLGGLKVEA
jgi:hypothetical protein